MGFTHTIDFGNAILELVEVGAILMLILWGRLLNNRVRFLEDRQEYVIYLYRNGQFTHWPTKQEVDAWVANGREV